MQLLICSGMTCHDSQSETLLNKLRWSIESKGLKDEVQVLPTGCFGLCGKGPVIKVLPDNLYYVNVKPEDVEEIVREHVVNRRKVHRLLYYDPADETRTEKWLNRKQIRIALRNCGFIDPENIMESIAHDAYQALGKVLSFHSPAETMSNLHVP